LLGSLLGVWSRAAKAATLRRRHVRGAHNLCETTDKRCQLAWLQVLLIAWMDVLVILQTAALRLGIRQGPAMAELTDPSPASCASRREAPLTEQLQNEIWHAEVARTTLAPLRIQHLTATAVFAQWLGFVAQVKQARSLAALVQSRIDSAVLGSCFRGWHRVIRKHLSVALSYREQDKLSKRSQAFKRALSAAALRSSEALCTLAASDAFKAWAAETRRARGRRLGSQEQLTLLSGMTYALWSQDQIQELVSHTIAAWKAGAIQSRLEHERLVAGQHFMALQHAEDLARSALLGNASYLTQRGLDMQRAVLAHRFLRLWHALVANFRHASLHRRSREQVGHNMEKIVKTWVSSAETSLQYLCLSGWHNEVLAYPKKSAAISSTKAECLAIMNRLVVKETATTLLIGCWLAWRRLIADDRKSHVEGELTIVVGLLHESTVTCRELRAQLISASSLSRHSVRCMMWALLMSWHQMVAQAKHEGLPSVAASTFSSTPHASRVARNVKAFY